MNNPLECVAIRKAKEHFLRALTRLLSGSGKKSANFLLRFEVYVGFRLHALVLTTVEPVVSLAPSVGGRDQHSCGREM